MIIRPNNFWQKKTQVLDKSWKSQCTNQTYCVLLATTKRTFLNPILYYKLGFVAWFHAEAVTSEGSKGEVLDPAPRSLVLSSNSSDLGGISLSSRSLGPCWSPWRSLWPVPSRCLLPRLGRALLAEVPPLLPARAPALAPGAHYSSVALPLPAPQQAPSASLYRLCAGMSAAFCATWGTKLRFSPCPQAHRGAGRGRQEASRGARLCFSLLSTDLPCLPHLPSERLPPEETGEGHVSVSDFFLPFFLQVTMARRKDRRPLHLGPYFLLLKVGFTLLLSLEP